jgi:poly(A) polymerase
VSPPLSNTFIQKISQYFKHKHPCDDLPRKIPRKKHGISRSQLSALTLKVLYRLKDAGFEAYLVGGGVRDLLLGRVPKDFDVATNAHPHEIRHLFRNSRIIGRRFQLVHVFFKNETIEVSTFRTNTPAENVEVVDSKHTMIRHDNTFGTLEEDAWRRDFTVNALYYNIADFSVVDYTDGLNDLRAKKIRVIGDPVQRFHEDPVRMLRAIRFSAKLRFGIETQAEHALRSLHHLLAHVPGSRLFDECNKLFFGGYAEPVFAALQKYDYFENLFPGVCAVLKHKKGTHEKLIELAMRSTDERIKSGQTVNPAFLFAVILWPVLQFELAKTKYKKNKFYPQVYVTIQEVLKKQVETIQIPKRLQIMIEAIWMMQFYITHLKPKKIYPNLHHRYFRAAYDFLALRVASGEKLQKTLDWWTKFQAADQPVQHEMIAHLKVEE